MTRIPPAVQHAALLLAMALLAWGATVLPTVDNLPTGLRDVLSALVAWLIGYAIPAVDTYGVKPRAVLPAKESL